MTRFESSIQHPSPTSRAPQFRMGTLLALTAAVAVICFVLFAVPDHAVRGALMLVLTTSVPAVLATVLLCGNRLQRAFCIGALFPFGVGLVSLTIMLGMRLFEAFNFARELSFTWTEMAVIVGDRCRWLVGACWLAGLCLGALCFFIASLFGSGPTGPRGEPTLTASNESQNRTGDLPVRRDEQAAE